MMNFAQSSPLGKSQVKSQVKSQFSQVGAPSFNTATVLTSVALVIVFAIVICLDSMSPGTTPDELLSKLVAFP